MEYNSNRSSTISGSVHPNQIGSAPERQKEIPSKMALVDKLLHDLSEEVLGMNGTFSAVLTPGAPQGNSQAAEAKQVVATSLGDGLDGFASRIQQSIYTLRDIRSRCEL